MVENAQTSDRPRLGSREVLALRRFLADVSADYAQLRAYESKYGGGRGRVRGQLAADVVRKIGLQMMISIRVMRMLRTSGHRLGAQVVSRLIRHVFGSHIHWDVDFEPGVVIAHTFGIALAEGVRIGSGCILCHTTSLGIGRDAAGNEGVPTLERNVHLGPHVVLIGPITVGEGSKVAAGSILRSSVPPRSRVAPPESVVESRKSGGDQDRVGPAGVGGARTGRRVV